MKLLHMGLWVLSGALLLVGCGKKEPSAVPATAETTAPAAVAAGPRVIEITANDAMKFSVTRIEAKPGEELKIVLINQGTQPKLAMGHNWVLLRGGVDVNVYAQKAAVAAAEEYLPKALADQVLAATKLLGPKQRDEVAFKAPDTAGEYPFLCTFPAHAALGMKGVLVVQ